MRIAGINFLQKFQLLFWPKKSCLEGIARQFMQVIIGEAELLLGELVFPAEESLKHLWIIGVEGNHQTVVKQCSKRMFFELRTDSRAQVAGQADIDGDLPFRKDGHQFRIVRKG